MGGEDGPKGSLWPRPTKHFQQPSVLEDDFDGQCRVQPEDRIQGLLKSMRLAEANGNHDLAAQLLKIIDLARRGC